jgi:hypothetical protein
MLKRARELNICPSKNLVLTEIDDLSVVTDEKDEHLIIPSKMNTNV